jgi:hypothetical protein
LNSPASVFCPGDVDHLFQRPCHSEQYQNIKTKQGVING